MRLIPDATLKVYPEIGHAVHWKRPEQVVRDLEAFMKDSRPVWSFITDPSANFRENPFSDVRGIRAR